jgi:hypothetical protein
LLSAALDPPEVVLSLLDEGLDEELGEALLEDELSLGVLLVLPLLGEVAPELMLPPLGGAPASLPDEEAPELEPEAPEPDPDELSPEDEAPALVPPELSLEAPPAPCAHAAVAKATMAAVTAALMSFRFIFSSSRVGMEMDCGAGGRKNNAVVRCASEEKSCANLSVWTFSARV